MEVRDREPPPPAPMTARVSTVRLPAGRERSSSLDGERAWRPASGFASKHQAELAAKRQQRERQLQRARQLQRLQEEKQKREEALAKGPKPNDHVIREEGEWKTVVSHGRRTRNDRRTAPPTLVAIPPAPPFPHGGVDATESSVISEGRSLSQDEGEGEIRRRRRQQTKRRQKVVMQSETPKVDCNGVPHPAMLGQAMFARRSSLQRLADKLHVDEAAAVHAAQRRSPTGRPNSPDYVQRKNRNNASAGTYHNGTRPHHYEGEESNNGHAHHAGTRQNRRSSSRLDSPRSGSESHSSPRSPRNRKCGDKRDFFFRNLNYELRSQLQVDEVAEFSVTDFEMATRISEAVLALFAPANDDTASEEDVIKEIESGEAVSPLPPVERKKFPLVVTDGTACVGGNVLSFCDFFTHVNAVENDTTRVRMLQHNLQVLKKTNARCIHANYLDVMLELEQDVVFLDPPWGGPEYKDLEKVDLFLGGLPLHEICSRLQGNAKCVILKVPSNFDDEKFAQLVPGKVVIRRDLKKMHLVLLDFR